jgi:hypothetical protein
LQKHKNYRAGRLFFKRNAWRRLAALATKRVVARGASWAG